MIKNGPMKMEYRGYKIEVATKRKDYLWAADVWFWTLIKPKSPISDWAGIEGHNSEGEAELAGLVWAKTAIDTIKQSKLPTR